jgi:hypothetical protein
MKLCACIVELRDIDLKEVFNKHAPFLPDDTTYFLFTKHELIEKYSNLLPNINIIPTVFEDDSVHCYNLLLTDNGSWFWKHFLDFDRVLIFQHDSGLLRTGIEEFYEYDFIGAPWYPDQLEYYPHCCNGGLSLRNPKIMLDISKQYYWEKNMGEDMYFTRHMVDNKIGNLAPYDIAKKFSVESLFELGTFGYHKPWYYLQSSQWEQIKNQYK